MALRWHPYWMWMRDTHDPDYPEFYQPSPPSPHLHYEAPSPFSFCHSDIWGRCSLFKGKSQFCFCYKGNSWESRSLLLRQAHVDSPQQAFGHAAASARSLPHVQHCIEWINSGYFFGEKKGTQQQHPTVSFSFSSTPRCCFFGGGAILTHLLF